MELLVIFEDVLEQHLVNTLVRPRGHYSRGFKEHKILNSPTGVVDHYLAIGHSVSIHNVKVRAKEKQWKAKEGIYIKEKAPVMN